MQGIFEFAGATLSWEDEILRRFPLIAELETPYRWRDKNPELGEWIMDARRRLINGERVEFAEPVTYRQAESAFDMEVLFQSVEGRVGTVAAIHCSKGICYRIAAAARGGYQAIEEMAAKTASEFAQRWDASPEAARRLATLRWLLSETFAVRKLNEGEVPLPEEAAVNKDLLAAAAAIEQDGPLAALEILALSRKLPRWRLHRRELLRDVERALSEVDARRCETMAEAAARIRDRSGIMGRRLPTRTVSTPLLLKGLEFDHVVVPSVRHFANESNAQAKLFYVAISRSVESLTVSGTQSFLHLPSPRL